MTKGTRVVPKKILFSLVVLTKNCTDFSESFSRVVSSVVSTQNVVYTGDVGAVGPAVKQVTQPGYIYNTFTIQYIDYQFPSNKGSKTGYLQVAGRKIESDSTFIGSSNGLNLRKTGHNDDIMLVHHVRR